MQIASTIAEARAFLDDARRGGRSVGLVPTMGFLHDGHVSLMVASTAMCDVTMTTIFVNPLQFAAHEDLGAYPRDLDHDISRCDAVGVDLLLVPEVAEMYPRRVLTTVSVAEISARLEGASRPEHFAGVATVVAKLFNIAGPCAAFFGEKDWQQLKIIERMAADLSFPVEVVGCPIVRESDGLAMSSRNVYLDSEHRQAATALSRALQAGLDVIASGAHGAAEVQAVMEAVMNAEDLVDADYVAVVDGATLLDVDVVDPGSRLLIAAQVGPARLIDNCAAFSAGRSTQRDH